VTFRKAALGVLGAARKAVLRAAGMRPPLLSLLETALFGMVFTALGLGAFSVWVEYSCAKVEDRAAALVSERLTNDARIYEAQLGALRRSDEQIIQKGAGPSSVLRLDEAALRGLGPEDLALPEEHPLVRAKAQQLRLGRDVSAFRLVALPSEKRGGRKAR